MQVGWDESTAGERQPRVSLWEIEPLTTFPMYPSPFPLRLKRPWPTGLPSLHGMGCSWFSLNCRYAHQYYFYVHFNANNVLADISCRWEG
jgi:hypothetical protein